MKKTTFKYVVTGVLVDSFGKNPIKVCKEITSAPTKEKAVSNVRFRKSGGKMYYKWEKAPKVKVVYENVPEQLSFL